MDSGLQKGLWTIIPSLEKVGFQQQNSYWT